jgi:methylamine dehydrogenase accessory protein MauD
MSGIVLASYLILWFFVIVLGFLVLVLYRQMGEMYLGTREARTRDGVRLGSDAPTVHATDLAGTRLQIPARRETLLAFVAPDCGPCRKLMPDLVAFTAARPELAVIAIGGADAERNEQFAREFGTRFPVLTQEQEWISIKYRVRSTPFAFYLDRAGVVRAKGIVNRMTQLEQLVGRGETLTPAVAGNGGLDAVEVREVAR